MTVRGIRGATTARANTREAVLEAAGELLEKMTLANDLNPDDIASVLFTVTRDLDVAFPASAARALGWNQVALFDAQAPTVSDDLPRCIRVLIHWNTDRKPNEIRHVYLREATQLRPDLIQGVTE